MVVGRLLFIRFVVIIGDVMGMNMVLKVNWFNLIGIVNNEY